MTTFNNINLKTADIKGKKPNTVPYFMVCHRWCSKKNKTRLTVHILCSRNELCSHILILMKILNTATDIHTLPGVQIIHITVTY